jgi:hypothetical protein
VNFFQDLIDLFFTTEQTVDRGGDTHIDILRTVSAFRTILAFIDESHAGSRRRPRIGEVADEIKVMSEALFALQVIDQIGRGKVLEISEAVRLL